jgi:hypothetical protein
MPTLAQVRSISASTIKRPMKLIDPHAGLMECAVCGSRHCASIKPRWGGQPLPRLLAVLIGRLPYKATLSRLFWGFATPRFMGPSPNGGLIAGSAVPPQAEWLQGCIDTASLRAASFYCLGSSYNCAWPFMGIAPM